MMFGKNLVERPSIQLVVPQLQAAGCRDYLCA